MNWVDRWLNRRADRRAGRRAAVLDWIAAHPDCGGYSISEGSGTSVSWTYVLLDELERDGEITARWADGPAPRRRLYRAKEST